VADRQSGYKDLLLDAEGHAREAKRLRLDAHWMKIGPVLDDPRDESFPPIFPREPDDPPIAAPGVSLAELVRSQAEELKQLRAQIEADRQSREFSRATLAESGYCWEDGGSTASSSNTTSSSSSSSASSASASSRVSTPHRVRFAVLAFSTTPPAVRPTAVALCTPAQAVAAAVPCPAQVEVATKVEAPRRTVKPRIGLTISTCSIRLVALQFCALRP